MLDILSITPSNNSISVPVDQNITIVFSEPIEPLTIQHGISVYTASDGIWTGPDLSQLDTKYSDVLSVSDDYQMASFSYTLNGNTLTLAPVNKFLEDKTYYISIFPGTDITKVLSTKTYDAPIYTLSASGYLEFLSPYTGAENGIYSLSFTSDTNFDLLFNSIYIDSYTFTNNSSIGLGNITIKLSGSFTNGDSIEFNVYEGVSVSELYKTSFTTNKYTVKTPTSQKIDDYSYNSEPSFYITNSIPANLSVNNSPSNPIVIRFNNNLNASQDISSKISITRTSIEDGKVKQLNYKYKILNNALKIYLVS